VFNNKAFEQQKNFNKQILDYEKSLNEQKERIFSLLSENKKLNDELQIFMNKEKSINDALVLAVEKAKEHEDTLKVMFEYELKRLEDYKNIYISYIEKIKRLLPIDKNLLEANKLMEEMNKLVFNSETNLQMDRLILKDQSPKNELQEKDEVFEKKELQKFSKIYKEEKMRLEKISNELYQKYSDGHNETAASLDISAKNSDTKLSPKEFFSLVQKMHMAATAHAIDLDEVLNPKNLPDLEILCKELGLK